MFTLLRHQYPAVGPILTHSVNLAFGPKPRFKNKFGAQAGFGLQSLFTTPFQMPVFFAFFNTRLKFGREAYNQVAPGITRPLQTPDMDRKKYAGWLQK